MSAARNAWRFFGGGAPARRWIAGVVGRAGAARIVALCLLKSLMAANAVAFALAMRQAIDAAVAGNAEGFWSWCGIFAGIICVQVACVGANRALLERTRSLFENQLRAHAFADVLGQPYAQAERGHSAELMTRMTSDAVVVAEGASTLIPTAVSMAVRLVGVLAALFALVPQLTVLFLVGGCVAAAASVAVRPLLKRLHASMQQAEGGMRSYMQECLDSLLVVHAFACERKVSDLAEDAMARHRRARLRKADVSNACSTLLLLGVQAAYVLGFAWCAFGILAGTCSYGTLMAVVQLVGQLQSPFSSLGGSFSKYSSMLASAERLMALQSSGEEGGGGQSAAGGRAVAKGQSVAGGASAASASFGFEGNASRSDSAALNAFAAESDGKSVLPHASVSDAAAGGECDEAKACAPAVAANFDAASFRRLGLSGVAFAYDDGEEVLRGCDFVLRAGEFVGIAGPSGAGKSTLTKVLLGAYEPNRGVAWAQDANGVRTPLAATRGLFAYVPQGNRLMAGTIRDVVAFASQGEPDERRVVAACEAACAWDFVSLLPNGLNTVLGQHGAGLSEGQMQRLAVARAVYSDAPVLLLDEAASALDAETERRMLENLRALPGKSAVLVTHREATLAACDRVVKVSGGACS